MLINKWQEKEGKMTAYNTCYGILTNCVDLKWLQPEHHSSFVISLLFTLNGQ